MSLCSGRALRALRLQNVYDSYVYKSHCLYAGILGLCLVSVVLLITRRAKAAPLAMSMRQCETCRQRFRGEAFEDECPGCRMQLGEWRIAAALKAQMFSAGTIVIADSVRFALCSLKSFILLPFHVDIRR